MRASDRAKANASERMPVCKCARASECECMRASDCPQAKGFLEKTNHGGGASLRRSLFGGGGREKAEELNGAGGACATGSVPTAYERRAGRFLKRPRHYLVLANASYQLPPVLTRPDFRSPRSPPHC
eukprot:6172983-Pleurochrysis_carterae.AAC.1